MHGLENALQLRVFPMENEPFSCPEIFGILVTGLVMGVFLAVWFAWFMVNLVFSALVSIF